MKYQRGKSKFRGFYTALALSLLMIGAACFFAYRQTSQTLEQNLDSIAEQLSTESTATEESETPVIQLEQDVPKETGKTTSETTSSATASETEPAETEGDTSEETDSATGETLLHQYTAPLSEYTVQCPFSGEELVKSETTGTWQTHNGVDLCCDSGAAVVAIDTGTITEICRDALWGYTITIDHDNGMTSRYCGLDGAMEVREGDIVASGQLLGIVGEPSDLESALGTHLHLEVRKNGTYVDPVAFFE